MTFPFRGEINEASALRLTQLYFWLAGATPTILWLKTNGLSQNGFVESLYHAGSLAKVRSSVENCLGALSAATESAYHLETFVRFRTLVSRQHGIPWLVGDNSHHLFVLS